MDNYTLVIVIIVIVIIGIVLIGTNREGMTNLSTNGVQSIEQSYNALNDSSNNLNNVNNLFVTGKLSLLPRGLVTPYHGSQEQIPAGWLLCDGSNETPDLKNRFILGTGSKTVGTIGGSETVMLNLNNVPSHSHSIKLTTTNNTGYDKGTLTDVTGTKNFGQYTSSLSLSTASGTNTTATGTGKTTVPTMPPYWTLAYIMRS